MKQIILALAIVSSSFAGLLTQTYDHLTKTAGKTPTEAIQVMADLSYLSSSEITTVVEASKLRIEPKLVLSSIEKQRSEAKKAAK